VTLVFGVFDKELWRREICIHDDPLFR